MTKYISTKGGIHPVGFDQAVLQGFAEDGGLFVPKTIPKIPPARLEQLAQMPYTNLAFEMVSPFIDAQIIPEIDLKRLIEKSFSTFGHPDLMPLVPLKHNRKILIMELFHGPTLSFKDIAMGFLVHTMDYLLAQKDAHLNLILATTGDTGPAAAFAAAHKPTIDCWPLYPAGMISSEQERQMTTLGAANIHPFCVDHCKDGGDDLDRVVARLFSNPQLRSDLKLSSVNSINWCRVMFQAVHYAYGYFKACETLGEPVDFCVPSGAFGNLFAGFLAKSMGIPIRRFICANNHNQTLHRAISKGEFVKADLIRTVSSAIDIVVPYNFWRFLYFVAGCDPDTLNVWMDDFDRIGRIQLDGQTRKNIEAAFDSCSIDDEATLSTIRHTWETEGYLLDPHGAVAVAGAYKMRQTPGDAIKTVCLATAHPAKFPDIIKLALNSDEKSVLPDDAVHPALVSAAGLPQHRTLCELAQLEERLISALAE